MRENLELLLIASRGNPVAPAPGQQFPSLIVTPRGEPSEKPELFAMMVERLYRRGTGDQCVSPCVSRPERASNLLRETARNTGRRDRMGGDGTNQELVGRNVRGE